jgi:hypothetical protein
MAKSKHRAKHIEAKKLRKALIKEKQSRIHRMVEVGKNQFQLQGDEGVEGMLEVGLNPEKP